MAKTERRTTRRDQPPAPAETRSSEAITVAWTTSVTAVLLCELVLIVLHFLADGEDMGPQLKLLTELLLFGGGVTGALSLVLLPIVYRVRRQPPPLGLTVFGVCVAVAPLLTMVLRAVR